MTHSPVFQQMGQTDCPNQLWRKASVTQFPFFSTFIKNRQKRIWERLSEHYTPKRENGVIRRGINVVQQQERNTLSPRVTKAAYICKCV